MAVSVAFTALLGLVSAAPSASNAGYKWLGRVNPATRELTWPATGLRFSFTGSSASIPITKQTGSNAFELIVDGGAPIIIDAVNSTSITTPTVSAKGTHTVQLRRKNEAAYGTAFVGEPVAAAGGCVFLTPTQAKPRRRIEIIGDSISVGYGADGILPCVNSAALEDGPKTYGALTANNLSADYSIVAWSGKGIIRNYCTTPPDTSAIMPEIYTRYGANDADNSYDFSAPVDAVVINLGTNDFGYLNCRDPLNITQYEDAMYNFAKKVQTKYPKAEFFFTSSPMLNDGYPSTADAQHTTQSNALQVVAKRFGSKGHFVDFPPQGSVVGCDYHPTLDTHAQLAVILTDAIKKVVSWA